MACFWFAGDWSVAYDLPVVAFHSGSRGTFHGPEIEYVVEGETGSLVDRAAGAAGLAAAVMAIAGDTDRLTALRERIRPFVDDRLQIETMVRNFGMVDRALRA
jgi:hypothetical protein